MIPIAGVQAFSTIDYPGVLSCVLFTQGCPWSCRYCHNVELQKFSPTCKGRVPWEDVYQFLNNRKFFLEAVVLSGGEPTAHPALKEVSTKIRSLGYKLALHTAGIYPERFKSVLPSLDWVGFDLKAPLDERYDRVTQVKNSAQAVIKSLDILLESGVAVQFRCTYHPLLLTERSLEELRELLIKKGVSAPLVIQDFRKQGCRDVALCEDSFS